MAASTITTPNTNLGGLGSQLAVDLLRNTCTQAAADVNAIHACQTAPAGTALTDTSTQTIQYSEGSWRQLPTLGQGGTLTLGTTGAVAGNQITITRTSTSANTYAIVNGGGGAGTLLTMPVSKICTAMFQFDGTNWALRQMGQLA
jgi:hypothetical protein